MAVEEAGVGDVADGDEDALEFEFAFLFGEEVLEFDGAHFAFVVGEVFGDGGVPDGFDFGVGEGAVGHDFAGAELVSAVDEVDGAGEAGEEGGFFCGGVAAADDGYWDVAVEGAVAGGAAGEAASDEGFFVGEAEVSWGGAGGDDDGFGLEGFVAVEGDVEVSFWGFGEGLDLGVFDAGAEFFCLGLHFHHEFWAHDAFWEAWEVFDFGGGGELSAGLGAGEHEWVEVGACGVDGGGEACAAGADDDDVFHGGDVVEKVVLGFGCVC